MVTIGERQEELICIVISLVPSSKLSFLPTKKKKYAGENLFYWLHNTGIVKPISYPGQVEKKGSGCYIMYLVHIYMNFSIIAIKVMALL